MTKKKLSPFAKGLLIYTGILLLLAVIGLFVFYGFIGAYERSRPASCMDRYLASMTEDSLSPACLDALPDLDYRIKSEEDNLSAVQSLLAEAKYVKLGAQSGPDHAAYALMSEGERIGLVYLEQGGQAAFGFRPWQVTGEDYDFSAFAHTLSLSLPEDYSVILNGVTLDKQYISRADVEYETLSQCYARYPSLPHLCVYEAGPYFGDAELEILDGRGNPVPEASLTEAVFLDNCDEDTKNALSQFCGEYLRRYVLFGSNSNGAYTENYYNLIKLVSPDSELADRIGHVMGLIYANTVSCEISSVTINLCSFLGDSRYLADVSYSTETVGFAGPVTEENNIRLVIVEDGGTLKAEAMFNY